MVAKEEADADYCAIHAERTFCIFKLVFADKVRARDVIV